MDIENVEYLKKLAERVEFYFDIRTKAIDYYGEYKQNVSKFERFSLLESLIITGVVWASHRRNELLTEEDVYILLGINADSLYTKTILTLHPDLQELTLQELFEKTTENFK